MTSLSPSRLSSIQAFGTDRLEVAPRHFGTGNVCAIQGRSDAGIRPAHLIILNIYTSKFPNPFIPSRPNIRSLGCYPRGMMLTLPLPQSLAARPTSSILALSNSQLSAPCPHFACELPQQIVQAQVRPSEMTSTTGNAESCFADLRRGGGGAVSMLRLCKMDLRGAPVRFVSWKIFYQDHLARSVQRQQCLNPDDVDVHAEANPL